MLPRQAGTLTRSFSFVLGGASQPGLELELGKPIPRDGEESGPCSDTEQLTLTAVRVTTAGADAPLYSLLLMKTTSKALQYPSWPWYCPMWSCRASYTLSGCTSDKLSSPVCVHARVCT